MNGANEQQAVILIIVGLIVYFGMGWQAGVLFKGRTKTVTCPWDMCQHNSEGKCQCKNIKLKAYIIDEDREGLACSNFQPVEENHIDLKT